MSEYYPGDHSTSKDRSDALCKASIPLGVGGLGALLIGCTFGMATPLVLGAAAVFAANTISDSCDSDGDCHHRDYGA